MAHLSYSSQSTGQQALLPIIGLSSPPHLSTVESPLSEPITCLSPFAFEKDINIWFRMTLAGRHAVDAKLINEDLAAAPIQCDHCDASWVEDQEILLPMQDIQTPTASTPYTPAVDDSIPSSPSSEGANTWSDASSSYSSITSSDLACMIASSADHIPPSTLAGHRCSGCEKFFRLKGDLRKHWFRTHEKRYSCTVPTCQAAFHLNADLARHNKSKHGVHGRKSRIPCEYAGCSETFTRRDNMIRHKREEHDHCGRKSKES